MAYNYEYPYVDSGRYNDDWLLNQMKRLRRGLKEEEVERKKEDAYLLERIEQEITDRANGDAEVRNELLEKLKEEQERAETAEKGLHDNIDTVSERLTNLDKENNEEHEALRNAISDVERELNTEIENRTNGYNELSEKVETYKTEIEKKVDVGLADVNRNISALEKKTDGAIADLENKDVLLDNNIKAEQARAEAAEKKLQSAVDGVDTKVEENKTLLQNEIDAESRERKAQDDLLTSKIENEAAAREAEDRLLEGKVNSKIVEEQERAEAAEQKLANDLEQEKNERLSVEESLQNQVTGEGQRARKKEKELEDAINTETKRAESEEDEIAKNLREETRRAQEKEADLDDKVLNEVATRKQEDENLKGDIADAVADAEESLRAWVEERLAGFTPTGEPVKYYTKTVDVDVAPYDSIPDMDAPDALIKINAAHKCNLVYYPFLKLLTFVCYDSDREKYRNDWEQNRIYIPCFMLPTDIYALIDIVATENYKEMLQVNSGRIVLENKDDYVNFPFNGEIVFALNYNTFIFDGQNWYNPVFGMFGDVYNNYTDVLSQMRCTGYIDLSNMTLLDSVPDSWTEHELTDVTVSASVDAQIVKDAVDAALAGKDLVTKDDVSQMVDEVVASKGYVTEDEVDAKGYVTEQGLTGKDFVTNAELNAKDYLTKNVADSTYQPLGNYTTYNDVPHVWSTTIDNINAKVTNVQGAGKDLTSVGSSDIRFLWERFEISLAVPTFLTDVNDVSFFIDDLSFTLQYITTPYVLYDINYFVNSASLNDDGELVLDVLAHAIGIRNHKNDISGMVHPYMRINNGKFTVIY